MFLLRFFHSLKMGRGGERSKVKFHLKKQGRRSWFGCFAWGSLHSLSTFVIFSYMKDLSVPGSSAGSPGLCWWKCKGVMKNASFSSRNSIAQSLISIWCTLHRFIFMHDAHTLGSFKTGISKYTAIKICVYMNN